MRSTLTLQTGFSLGSYEILGALGAGGMGEVYRARDRKLGRQVAIKVLPEDVALDAERLARFEREARALASLNHPNIAHLYGFERANLTPTAAGGASGAPVPGDGGAPVPGTGRAPLLGVSGAPAPGPGEGRDLPFLVMELVEGETLADRIARGAIPIEEAIPIFLEIARGVEAAHQRGVIHRDLKPANIKLAGDAAQAYSGAGAGGVKILDFGLAKAMAPEAVAAGEPSASLSPTLTLAATQRGEILGTAAYMAPEQARGRAVDARADLWSFGVCLHEALTGKQLFAGEDAAETLANVLTRKVDLGVLPAGTLPATTPPALRRLLRRCLERDPGRRAQHIGDLRLDLEDALAESGHAEEGAPPVVARGRRLSLAGSLALALPLAALAAGAGWLLRTPPPPPVAARAILSAGPSDPLLPTDYMGDLAMSADGRIVVYRSAAADGALYVRAVDRLEGVRLQGTEGALNPILSPDGAWVAYNDPREGSTLRKVSTAGGAPAELCALPGVVNGGAWSRSGFIVVAIYGKRGLYRVPENGGDLELLVGPPEGSTIIYRWPMFLPGERTILFTAYPDSSSPDSFERTETRAVSLASGEQTLVMRGGTHPQYANGHLFLGSDGTLSAVPFDPERLLVRGTPRRLLAGVVHKVTGTIDFVVSAEGSLVYVAGDGEATGEAREMVWVDALGNDEVLETPPRNFSQPRVSPDGRRIAVVSTAGQSDLWLWDLESEVLSRLTFDPSEDSYPLWAPDGASLYFGSSRGGNMDLYRLAMDGTNSVELMLDSPAGILAPFSITPDGRFLLYLDGGIGNRRVGVLDLANRRPAEEGLLQIRGTSADLSPDGRWLAYGSGESGRREVYVSPFPELDSGLWQITTEGGDEPVWSEDGSELYYAATGGERGRILAVPIRTQPAFAAGRPRELPRSDFIRGFYRSFDVGPGPRFLILRRAAAQPEDSRPQVVLVQGFAEELQRLAPAE